MDDCQEKLKQLLEENSALKANLQMTHQDRDNWRGHAERVMRENAQLRDTLARQRDDVEAFSAGGNGIINITQRQRDQYRRERDHAVALYENVINLLAQYVTILRRRVDAREPEVQKAQNMLQDLAEWYGIPAFTALAGEVANAVIAASVEDYNKLIGTAIADLGGEYKVWDTPQLAILEIAKLTQVFTASFYGQFLALQGYNHAFDPRIVCADIIKECRVHGAPTDQTLSRLQPQWVKENLPNPPEKMSTLAEGLARFREAQKYPTVRGFAEASDRSERTLRLYKNWYEAIEAMGLQMPDEVKAWRTEVEENQ